LKLSPSTLGFERRFQARAVRVQRCLAMRGGVRRAPKKGSGGVCRRADDFDVGI
jgi:hypothetical protein